MTTTPKTLSITECHQLLDALLVKKGTEKQFRKAIRNYTIALLMLDAGLRVGEVVKVKIISLWVYGQATTNLYIPPWDAKNKQERTIPLSERIRNAVRQLHECFWSAFSDDEQNYAFYQTEPTKPVTTRQVERIIRKAALKSIGRPIHPHILRHTFASRLMKKIDMRTVQEMLGHSQMSSTQIYTHPNLDDAKKAIEELNLPSAVPYPETPALP